MRHAYFTGAHEPYEKLQRALKAEIDEAAWKSLCSTVSRPFEAPSTVKIAVKVINEWVPATGMPFRKTMSFRRARPLGRTWLFRHTRRKA